MKEKIDLAFAQNRAAIIRDLLSLNCERIEIAGSIRRERPMVGDIEIVCAPKFLDYGMFPTDGLQTNCLWLAVDKLVVDGVLQYAYYEDKNGRITQRRGEKYRGVVFAGAPETKIEIFTVPSLQDWAVNFTIRTGSAEFSHAIMTWLFVTNSPFRVHDGRLWRRDEHIPCPEERDFFDAIGIAWVEPRDRNTAADVQAADLSRRPQEKENHRDTEAQSSTPA